MHALVLAVVLGLVAVILVSTFSTSYESIAAGSLGVELRLFAQTAALRPTSQTLEAFSYRYLQTHPIASGDAVLVSLTHNARIETTGGLALDRSSAVERLLTSSGHLAVARAMTIGGRSVELVTAPLYDRRSYVGTIVAAEDLTPFVKTRTRVLDLSLAEAGIALFAGTASSYILLRHLLRTVGRITVTADELGRLNLDQRLGDQGSDDEVGDLARTFDEMLDRIDRVLQGQRRLLADVSHQLRTPLTIARGHLEILGRSKVPDRAALRESIEVVVDEIAHMGAIVERLLMLGHAMDPDFLETHPVDLRALLGDCFAAAKVLEPREYTLGPVPDVVIDVDEDKVRGAILNLVSNAVHATTTGDAIRLSAAINGVRSEIELVVEDSGPGIPISERTLALERYARPGPRAAGGTGLGLAIVRAVSEAHGGRVLIDSSVLGGARVTIVLPCALLLEQEEDPR